MQWKDGLSQDFVPAALIEGMCRFLVVRFLFPLPCGFIVLTQKEQKKNLGCEKKNDANRHCTNIKNPRHTFFSHLLYFITSIDLWSLKFLCVCILGFFLNPSSVGIHSSNRLFFYFLFFLFIDFDD